MTSVISHDDINYRKKAVLNIARILSDVNYGNRGVIDVDGTAGAYAKTQAFIKMISQYQSPKAVTNTRQFMNAASSGASLKIQGMELVGGRFVSKNFVLPAELSQYYSAFRSTLQALNHDIENSLKNIKTGRKKLNMYAHEQFESQFLQPIRKHIIAYITFKKATDPNYSPIEDLQLLFGTFAIQARTRLHLEDFYGIP